MVMSITLVYPGSYPNHHLESEKVVYKIHQRLANRDCLGALKAFTFGQAV